MRRDRPQPSAEPGHVLLALDEATLDRHSYDFVTRDGDRRRVSVSRNHIRVIEVRTYTPTSATAKFDDHELTLVQPYNGWDRHKRFCWYFARHFLLTTAELAKDTLNTDAIADLKAEQERIKALETAEAERLKDITVPTVPETFNIRTQ